MIKRLASVSKKLRQQSTEAEKRLWSRLRAKQMDTFKFRRQQQIGQYIADFVCFEKGLIIELDGGQHALEHFSKYCSLYKVHFQKMQALPFVLHPELVEGSKGRTGTRT